MIATDRSPKCFAFRVAMAARRDNVMPAICVPRTSIGLPLTLALGCKGGRRFGGGVIECRNPSVQVLLKKLYKGLSEFRKATSLRHREQAETNFQDRDGRHPDRSARPFLGPRASRPLLDEQKSGWDRPRSQELHTFARLRIMNVSLEYSATCHHRY
jgi:hypothetical protein